MIIAVAFRNGVVHAAFGFAWCKLVGLAERYHLGKYRGVARYVYILIGDKYEPEVVVAEGCSGSEMHTCVPPVEYVSFGKLMCGVVDNLSTGIAWVAIKHTHHILQLVAESSGTAHLIETCAGKEARRIDLIEVPAVEHIVETPVGGLDLNLTELFIPEGYNILIFFVDCLYCRQT